MTTNKKKRTTPKSRPKKPVVLPSATERSWSRRGKFFMFWAGWPLLIYFVLFAIITWPWLPNFSRAFMTDAGDGLQNVWNIWWVNKSVTELHQLPWHTSFLHHPHGVTLLGQTLNPFNGFVAILLLPFLSLAQAFNTMVIFSFVVSGLTAFWLCYYFSKSYIASLFGGFIFTFSSYHLAHGIGHMQLISTEWIPVFVLLWWQLLKVPRYKTALAAALALLLVLLCDYYYFLYCVLIAGLIFLYFWWRKELPPLKQKKKYLPLGLFVLTCLLIVAPLPLALLRLNSTEVLSGSHPSRELSTNFLAPFINGGFWYFSSLTRFYWSHVQAYVAESSVYLGVSVLTLMVIALIKRKRLNRDVNFWIGAGLFFGILSFGPRLQMGRNSVESLPLPYALLEKVFPPLKLSGVPIRMMVMVTLSVAIISAIVLAKASLKTTKSRLLLVAFGVVLFIEMLPMTLPTTPLGHPRYVKALKELPYGAVFDNATTTAPQALYSQTYHERPMVLGYISRTPKSVEDKDWQVVAAVLENRFSEVCKTHKTRYYTVSALKPIASELYPIVYRDNDVLIYDLKNSDNC